MKTPRFIPSSWRRLAAWAGFAVVGMMAPQLPGAGIAAFKQQPFHSDDLAEIIVYASIRRDETSWRLNLGNKEFNCDLSKIVGTVTVHQLPDNITTAESKAVVRKGHEEMSAFAARYSKAAPILKPYLEQFDAALRHIDRGEVFRTGRWISKAEFAEIMRQSEARDAERRRPSTSEQLAARFAEEQRRKGLELYGQQWLPKAEVEALLQRDKDVQTATAEVDAKSVGQMLYSVFLAEGEGLLVQPHGGAAARAGLHTSRVFLHGSSKEAGAEGDLCRGDFYWCGTHRCSAQSGKQETVPAYCRSRDEAIARVAKELSGSR